MNIHFFEANDGRNCYQYQMNKKTKIKKSDRYIYVISMFYLMNYFA